MFYFTARELILIFGGCAVSISSAFVCEYSRVGDQYLLLLLLGLATTYAGSWLLVKRLPRKGRFAFSGLLFLTLITGAFAVAALAGAHGCGGVTLLWSPAILLLVVLVFISGVAAADRN